MIEQVKNWIDRTFSDKYCPNCGKSNPENEVTKTYNQKKYSRCCTNCGIKY